MFLVTLSLLVFGIALSAVSILKKKEEITYMLTLITGTLMTAAGAYYVIS